MDHGGAGDQEIYLFRKLLNGFDRDGKSQVTIENGTITSIVLSVQGKSQTELRQHIKKTGIQVDPSRVYVNRSAAYMARWIALQLLNKYSADEVIVKLGYVIGHDKPLIKSAYADGKEIAFNYDCRPLAIIERFNLRKPIYTDLAKNGHFGRKNLKWEQINH